MTDLDELLKEADDWTDPKCATSRWVMSNCLRRLAAVVKRQREYMVAPVDVAFMFKECRDPFDKLDPATIEKMQKRVNRSFYLCLEDCDRIARGEA